MFKVFVAETVWAKIDKLENYLVGELALSEQAAYRAIEQYGLDFFP